LDLSLAQYFSIEQQILRNIEREDFRTGLLESRLRNLGGVKNTHPFDAFPVWKNKQHNKKQDIQANMRNTYSALKKLALQGKE
jgi:hypothetical protein